MPTDDANPDSENEIQFDAEPENGEGLKTSVSTPGHRRQRPESHLDG
jgi:hypothetical protein